MERVSFIFEGRLDTRELTRLDALDRNSKLIILSYKTIHPSPQITIGISRVVTSQKLSAPPPPTVVVVRKSSVRVRSRYANTKHHTERRFTVRSLSLLNPTTVSEARSLQAQKRLRTYFCSLLHFYDPFSSNPNTISLISKLFLNAIDAKPYKVRAAACDGLLDVLVDKGQTALAFMLFGKSLPNFESKSSL